MQKAINSTTFKALKINDSFKYYSITLSIKMNYNINISLKLVACTVIHHGGVTPLGGENRARFQL